MKIYKVRVVLKNKFVEQLKKEAPFEFENPENLEQVMSNWKKKLYSSEYAQRVKEVFSKIKGETKDLGFVFTILAESETQLEPYLRTFLAGEIERYQGEELIESKIEDEENILLPAVIDSKWTSSS